MHKTVTAALIAIAAAALGPPPETINHEVNARVRQEGRDNSQIMRTMHYLTDVYGPRLTGSPNHKAAAEWAVKQMSEWGFANGHLEPWEFGHPGWLNERFSGFIVSPVKDSLVGEVLAWTPSTKGTVTAEALQVVVPDRPVEAELAAWIAETAPRLRQLGIDPATLDSSEAAFQFLHHFEAGLSLGFLRGAGLPWGAFGALKFAALLFVVFIVLKNGWAEVTPLVLGYASLPIGIVVGQLGRSPSRQKV